MDFLKLFNMDYITLFGTAIVIICVGKKGCNKHAGRKKFQK